MMTELELENFDSLAKLTPGLKSSQAVKKLVVEVRRLKHMLQNQEDAMTQREMVMRSLKAERDEFERQKDNAIESLDRLCNIPPEIREKIKVHTLMYGTAHLKMTWTAKNKVEYEMIEPEGT